MKHLFTLLSWLVIATFPAFGESEPNDNYSQANPLSIGVSDTGTVIQTELDWFTVTLPEDGSIHINLVSSDYIYINLVDSNGTTNLYSEYGTNNVTRTISGLRAGSYFIALYNYYSATSPTYTITVTNTPTPVPNDPEPNDNALNAQVLNLNDSVTGHINYYYNGTRDLFDWWKVTTNLDGRLDFSITSHNGSYVYAELFDSNATTFLTGSYHNSTGNYSQDGLRPGTYYIRVKTLYGNEYVPYTLRNNLVLPLNLAESGGPNEVFTSATPMNIGDSINGHVGYYYNNMRDSSDWFTFTMVQDGRIDFKLNVYNNTPIYLHLYDGNGTTHLEGAYTYNSIFQSKDGLAAGQYYLRVIPYYSNEFAPYSIILTQQFTVPTDQEPNGHATTAVPLVIGDSVTGHIGYGYMGVRDVYDWYSFTTSNDGKIVFTLNVLNGQNVYAELFDGDSVTYLAGSYTTSTATYSRDGLQAGTYYIRIRTYYGNEWAPYTLKINLETTVPNDPEPNDSIAVASIINDNDSLTGHIGYYYYGNDDLVDWWKFTVSSDGQIVWKITSLNGQNVYAQLFDNDGTTLLGGNYTTGSQVYQVDGLAAGTYYLRVRNYYDNEFSPYSLKVNHVPAVFGSEPEPNGTVAMAIPLTVNTTVTGTIGYYYNDVDDTSDYYRLVLPVDGKLTLTIDPEYVQYVYAILLDSNGTTALLQDYTTSILSQTKNDLAAGTYYIRIRTYYNNEYSPYTLTTLLEPMNFPAEDTARNNNPYRATLLRANTPTTGHLNFYYNLQRDNVDWWVIGYDGTGPMTISAELEQNHFNAGYPSINWALFADTSASSVANGQWNSASHTYVLPSPVIRKYYLRLTQASNTFGAYRVTASYTENCANVITINSSEQVPVCSGSITYTVSNGLAEYDVQLYKDGLPYGPVQQANPSVTFSGLPVGDYYARSWSFGGSGSCDNASDTITFSNPPEPAITADGPLTFCQGESVVLTSDSAHSYLWSNGATTRSTTISESGTYTVTVYNEALCSSVSQTVTVIVNPLPAVPVVSANGPLTFCEGGNVTLTSSPEQSYLWSNTATTQSIVVDESGVFSVTVTDLNGCTNTSGPVSVTVNDLPGTPVVIADGPLTFCQGDDVNLSAPAGYNYNWTGGASTQSIDVNSTGTYSVVITDANGCSNTSAPVSVTVDPLPSVPVITSSTTLTLCENGSITLTSSPENSYAWNTAETTQSITVTSAGVYTVTVTNTFGCTASSSVTVNPAVPIVPLCSVSSNVSCNGESDGVVSLSSAGGTGAVSISGDATSGLSAGTYTYIFTDDNGCVATCSATVTEPDVLSAVCSVISNVSCNGGNDGEVSVSATGGTAPYVVSGQLTGLSAGTYSYTVTDDNGCTASCSFTITEPVPLAASAIATNTTCAGCNDGSVQISSIAGGTGPYNISPASPMTDLAPGTYCFTITDDNGCTTTACATVNSAGCNLSATCSVVSNVSCAGGSDGSATVSVTGGAGPYTYLWSDNQTTQQANGLTAGTYSVSVTDQASGCTTSCVVTITEPMPLSATAIPTDATCPTCADGSLITGSVTGGTSPYQVSPSSPMTGLLPGPYCFTVTDDNGCTTEACGTVASAAGCNLIATCSVDEDVNCNGGSDGSAAVSVSGGTGPFTYLWSDNQATSNATGLTAGTYSVTVTDQGTGCTASCSVTISEPPALLITVTPLGNISCFGGTALVQVTASGGAGSYLGTGTFNQSAGTDSYTVMDGNGCIASGSLTLSEPVKLEATASATDANCGQNDGTVSVSASGGTGAFDYLWTPGGATTASVGALASGTYTVIVTDDNGCTATSTAIVGAVGAGPAAPGQVAGPAGACRNSSGIVYSVPPVPGASSYVWTLPAGATGSSNTNSITLSFDNTFGGGFICVAAINGCDTGATSCINIPVLTVKPHVPAMPTPGPIVCGPGQVTFSVPPVANALSYTWSTSGNGLTILSGQGTNSVVVDISSAFGQGTIRVSASNCVGTSNMRIMALTGIPVHSNALVGPASVCAGTSNVSYFFPAVNGSSLVTWSVTGDISIASSSDNGVTVDFGPAFTSGMITVTTSNACGSYSKSYTIRSVPTQPGSVSGPASNVCNKSGVVYTLVSPVPGATSYQWTVPQGVTLNSPADGMSINVTFSPGFVSGTFCISAINACGSSTARCFNVISAPAPPTPITGPASVCKSQTGVLYSVPLNPDIPAYSWSITGGAVITPIPAGATVNFTTAVTPSAVVRVNAINACGVSQPASKSVAVNLACRTANEMSSVFTAYPNPSDGKFTVTFNSPGGKAVVRIVNLLGNLVGEYHLETVNGFNQAEFDLSKSSKGIYVMSIETIDGISKVQRIIIE